MLVTAPAPERLEQLGWTGGEPICDLRTALHYFRTTPDGRIAFGGVGRAHGRGSAPDTTSLPAVGPRGFAASSLVAGRPIEEGWGSAVALSATAHPWFGTLRPAPSTAPSGTPATALAQCHLGGRALSALALGAEDEVTRLPMVDGNPKRFPPEPFTSIGTRLVPGHPPQGPAGGRGEASRLPDSFAGLRCRGGSVTALAPSAPRRGSGRRARRWRPSGLLGADRVELGALGNLCGLDHGVDVHVGAERFQLRAPGPVDGPLRERDGHWVEDGDGPSQPQRLLLELVPGPC